MPKSDRILGLFPSFYGSHEQYKLLYRVVRQLAAPLEEADTHLFRIQRAHRLLVAEHVEDILRLAAALDLTAFHFEDILDSAHDYDTRLALMRRRVQGIAALHLRGLGTPWAVLQSAALYLNATVVPEHPDDPLVKHLDEFSHRAVIEFGHLPEKPRRHIVLHENPYQRHKTPLREYWGMDTWQVENDAMTATPGRFVIQGVGDRTAMPVVYCLQTQQGFRFNGVVPDGQILVIDAEGGATLNDRQVDDWVVTFEGALYDGGRFGTGGFVLEQGGELPPYDGEHYEPSVAPDRKDPPAIPLGHSDWHVMVEEGAYDSESLFDFAVYDVPDSPIGVFDSELTFDACIYALEASAIAGFAWDKRVPAAFKLLLPDVPDAAAGDVDYIGRLGSLMGRYKPAGVRAFVDAAPDAWVLGLSVLRDPDAADGPGIATQSTRLVNTRREMRVTLTES